jgi:hypothetical protein
MHNENSPFRSSLLLAHPKNIIHPTMSRVLSQDVHDEIHLSAYLQHALLHINSAAALSSTRNVVTGDLALRSNQSIHKAFKASTMVSSFLLY